MATHGKKNAPATPAPRTEPAPQAGDSGTWEVLPHTGLRAPHARLVTRNLRQWLRGSAVAFEADLYLDDTHVGRVTNPLGTTTQYEPVTGAPFGRGDLTAYAARCRDEQGQHVSAEVVLDTLIEEGETADAVRSLRDAGRTPIRLVRPVADSELRHPPVGIAAPADAGWWPVIVDALHRKRPLRHGETYQLWSGEAWLDLPTPGDVHDTPRTSAPAQTARRTNRAPRTT